jgi:hypothetical protein
MLSNANGWGHPPDLAIALEVAVLVAFEAPDLAHDNGFLRPLGLPFALTGAKLRFHRQDRGHGSACLLLNEAIPQDLPHSFYCVLK